MPETFLNNAQLTGLSADARRTEILRARGFAALEAQLSALDVRLTAVEAVVTPTAWTAPTLLNSWVDYGGGYQTIQYRKVGDMVQVRGLGKNGTIGFVNAFVLPTGFRPPALLQIESYRTTDVIIAIGTDGSVQPVSGTSGAFWFDFEFSVTT